MRIREGNRYFQTSRIWGEVRTQIQVSVIFFYHILSPGVDLCHVEVNMYALTKEFLCTGHYSKHVDTIVSFNPSKNSKHRLSYPQFINEIKAARDITIHSSTLH